LIDVCLLEVFCYPLSFGYDDETEDFC